MKNEIGTGIADIAVLNEIYEIVKTHTKSQYQNVIYQKASYPLMYHLAELRGNIIQWVPISKEHSVLEIGAECGAITETLVQKAGKVTYITDTKLQDNIIRMRIEKNISNLNKSKITGYYGQYCEIENKLEKYDYIILVGNFRYASEMLNDSKNPYVELLKQLRIHLKQSGRVILADANRLGLKYFAGCQEDYFGGYFEGIEGYPTTQGFKTFTHCEYMQLLKDAGYENIEFYYPYPDYKFTTTIYSENYLPQKGELGNNLRNFDRERYQFFDERRVFDTLIEEGLFEEFSNSFLICAN